MSKLCYTLLYTEVEMFSQQDFNKEVFAAIVRKTGAIPSNEECKAVAHHMEYNIRADRHLANNGHLKISTQELRQRIIQQINQNLHKNDLPRYTDQYRKYKKNQRFGLFSLQDKQIIADIATGKKNVADFTDKELLKNAYLKYFNQILMPKIEKISLQKKNNLQYHGLWHTEQVAMLSIDIAIKENRNPLPILLAAGLHDCARTTDDKDPNHGVNCMPIAENFLNSFPDKNLVSSYDKRQIVEAIVFHNVSSSRPKNNPILDCLQDADSMRLLWSGHQRFTPNTNTGRYLAQYSSYEQIKYLASLIEGIRAARPSNYGNNGNYFAR